MDEVADAFLEGLGERKPQVEGNNMPSGSVGGNKHLRSEEESTPGRAERKACPGVIKPTCKAALGNIKVGRYLEAVNKIPDDGLQVRFLSCVGFNNLRR